MTGERNGWGYLQEFSTRIREIGGFREGFGMDGAGDTRPETVGEQFRNLTLGICKG